MQYIITESLEIDLRMKPVSLPKVKITKRLRLASKSIKINFLTILFKYPKQLSHVKHAILRCTETGKQNQVLNSIFFEMTHLGQESDFRML